MSEQLGAAILGTGDVSTGHIEAYQADPRTEVRAILSRDRDRAEAAARRHGLDRCRAFTSLDELLRADDIHLVSICRHGGAGAAATRRHTGWGTAYRAAALDNVSRNSIGIQGNALEDNLG